MMGVAPDLLRWNDYAERKKIEPSHRFWRNTSNGNHRLDHRERGSCCWTVRDAVLSSSCILPWKWGLGGRGRSSESIAFPWPCRRRFSSAGSTVSPRRQESTVPGCHPWCTAGFQLGEKKEKMAIKSKIMMTMTIGKRTEESEINRNGKQNKNQLFDRLIFTFTRVAIERFSGTVRFELVDYTTSRSMTGEIIDVSTKGEGTPGIGRFQFEWQDGEESCPFDSKDIVDKTEGEREKVTSTWFHTSVKAWSWPPWTQTPINL